MTSKSTEERSRIPLKAIEDVVYMTWNRVADHLIVVLNTGYVRFYDYAGKSAAPSLPMDIPIICAPCENGFVALVDNVMEAKLVLVELSQQNGYTTRELLLPQSIRGYLGSVTLVATGSKGDKRRGKEVFLSYSPGTANAFICRCVFGPTSPTFTELAVPIDGGRVREMCRSPDGTSIAFMMEDGSLYVTSSGFSEVMLLHRSEDGAAGVRQMSWCGEHCITYLKKITYAGAEEDDEGMCTLVLTNTADPDNTDNVPDLPYDTCLLSEDDGVWMMSRDALYFLQEVPLPVQRVFSVGSRAPAALLLTTYDEFMTGDASAVRMLQNLQRHSGTLITAVMDCVEAAGFEFDPAQQKRLLRIAAFGRTFCTVCDPGAFVGTSKRLRVRNHLRFEAVGMTMTDLQLTTLGDERLLQRLAFCNEHQVAFCVADTLTSDIKPVMMNWALSRLANAAPRGKDEERNAARTVVKKLKSCNFCAFAELAQHAKATGRGAAALVLLDAEPSPGQQVPMLLRIGEADAALKRAIASCDADLIFTVMMHLVRARGASVITLLAANNVSHDVLLQYVGMCEGNQQLMTEYFAKNPRIQAYFYLCSYFREESRLSHAVSESIENAEWEMLQECKSADIQAAAAATKKAVEQTPRQLPTTTAFSPIGGGGTPFPMPMIEERYLLLQGKLLEEQAQLMKEFKDFRFLQASVADTIRYALEHGRPTVAQRLKADFSVPDKMHQRCMLAAYLSTGQWDLIDDVSGVTSNKKTVLDGEAYVTALLAYKRPQQAKQYISRIPQVEIRMEYYVLCGDWLGAGAECKRSNDPDLLIQLKDRAKGSADLLVQIEEGWKSSTPSTGINFPKFF